MTVSLYQSVESERTSMEYSHSWAVECIIDFSTIETSYQFTLYLGNTKKKC